MLRIGYGLIDLATKQAVVLEPAATQNKSSPQHNMNTHGHDGLDQKPFNNYSYRKIGRLK